MEIFHIHEKNRYINYIKITICVEKVLNYVFKVILLSLWNNLLKFNNLSYYTHTWYINYEFKPNIYIKFPYSNSPVLLLSFPVQ